mmetsp:Transcript_9788/g.24900  ORF Transcript_9788/g.24900 Transcript_9788/m.24900 type:complete len:480 (+) Transcript_9788:299-1738(+)
MKHKPPPPPPPPPPPRRSPPLARNGASSSVKPQARHGGYRSTEPTGLVNPVATKPSPYSSGDECNLAVDWRGIPEQAFRLVVERVECAQASRFIRLAGSGEASIPPACRVGPVLPPNWFTASLANSSDTGTSTFHPLPRSSQVEDGITSGRFLQQRGSQQQTADSRNAARGRATSDTDSGSSDVPALRLVSRDWRRLTDACVSLLRPAQLKVQANSAGNAASTRISASWSRQFPWVDTLDLSRWPLALEDTQFRAQALTLRHLRSLVVAGKNDLTNEQLMTFGNFPRLKRLSLTHCNKVSDDGLRCLAKELPELEHLELAYCRCLTDDSLTSIKSLMHLRSLSLKSTIGVTDVGLRELVALQKLEALNLTFCYRISDWGISSLRGLANLRELNLTDCTNCTDAGLAALHPLSCLHRLIVGGCHSLTRPAQIAAKYAPGGLLQLHLWRQKQRSSPYSRPHAQVERRHALLLEIRSYRHVQ